MLGHLFFQNGFLSSVLLEDPLLLSDRSSDVEAVACSSSSSSFSFSSDLASNGEASDGGLEICEAAVPEERPDFCEAGRELVRVESPQAPP